MAVAVAGDPLVPVESGEMVPERGSILLIFVKSSVFQKQSIHHPRLAPAVAGYPQAPVELGEMVLAGESTVLEINLGPPTAESPNCKNNVNPDFFLPSEFLWSLYHGSRGCRF